LQQKLAAYQGQPFNNQLMHQIEREAKGIDKHLAFKWSTTPEMENGQRAYTLRLSLDTGFGVGGGVATPVLSAAPPVPDSSGNPPQRIRVGGNVQQMMLIEQPRPVYPMEAKKARIQGVVRLDAVIAKDGTMLNLSVDSGHPLLVPAALEAVKHWIYKPTLLNGEPVEVVTKIDVNFTLSQ
jgi:TonB family protein